VRVVLCLMTKQRCCQALHCMPSGSTCLRVNAC
jgi:hypothetical protein